MARTTLCRERGDHTSMNDSTTQMNHLLQRTALVSPFPLFLKDLQHIYPTLGDITDVLPIMEGYESANILLQCGSRRYVLKIFEKTREKENIDAMVKILIEAPGVGVPTFELVEGVQGKLSRYQDEGKDIYYYLTKFFEGENYDQRSPSESEIEDITRLLSELHTLSFPVVEAYNSWGNKNLVKEFEKRKATISSEIKSLIVPVVEECRKVDMAEFSKSVIHGDMQRKHVFRNSSGEYCIFDFGCMSYDAKVIDVSTYLAWFCFGIDTWKDHHRIMHDVIATYTQTHPFSEKELQALPVLTRASYASYLLITSDKIAAGDTSEETTMWNHQAKELLIRSTDL